MKQPWYRRAFRLAEPMAPVQPQRQAIVVTKTVEIGKSGSVVYAGYPEEEYLQSLQNTQRADKFDEMRRSDPQVVMCLSSVKGPIKSGIWEIEPGDDSPESQADAELMRQIFFEDNDFEQFISEALTVVDFGHSVFEFTDCVKLNHQKFGSYNSLKSIAWRSPRTIIRWIVNKDTGLLDAIEQQSYGDLASNVTIDARWLLIFTLNKEGSNFEGISALRPCFGNWLRKLNYLKLNASGIEKFAVPTPIATIPTGLENSEQAANLKQVLSDFATHQTNWIVKPQGWDLELNNNNNYDPSKVETSIDSEDKRMAKAFMANFLELGMGTTGSYSLSNDLSDFFLASLEYIGGMICKGVNTKLMKRMVELNRGPRQVYPKLKVRGISDKIGKEFADMLKLFVDSKVVTPDDQLEDSVRTRTGLPKRSLLGQRVVTPQPAMFAEGERGAQFSERILKRLKE